MFHVGGARSALQNWIYAKQHKGVFVLRIEDTDAARNRPEWTEGIISALDWIGISPATYEGPYFQSAYTEKQKAAAAQLYEAGRAYYCDCTRDAIQARTGNKYTGYDGYCRDRGLVAGEGRALRFRTPDEGQTRVVDLIRGEPTFENSLIEDFVIARADGSLLALASWSKFAPLPLWPLWLRYPRDAPAAVTEWGYGELPDEPAPERWPG